MSGPQLRRFRVATVKGLCVNLLTGWKTNYYQANINLEISAATPKNVFAQTKIAKAESIARKSQIVSRRGSRQAGRQMDRGVWVEAARYT